MNTSHEHNNFINFWTTLANMDLLLQRSVTAVFMPCNCLRIRELNEFLEQFSYELIICSQYRVGGVSVEERYPALFQDLQTIHESVENLQDVLHSQCNKRFTRLYHALLNFRSCLLFFRWREAWFYPEEMLQTSFSVFSMFDPMYSRMETKDTLNKNEWKGLLRLVNVAWAERELMKRTQNLIPVLLKGQIGNIVQESFHCLNEMEYAVTVKSKNHFRRNYEKLMELYQPVHDQTKVKSK